MYTYKLLIKIGIFIYIYQTIELIFINSMIKPTERSSSALIYQRKHVYVHILTHKKVCITIYTKIQISTLFTHMIVTIPTNHIGLRYFYNNKILFKNF